MPGAVAGVEGKTMGNKRNVKTTHPRKSARRERALLRGPKTAHETLALEMRIGKPPRSWPSAEDVRDAAAGVA